ncbi:C-myc promoter-binding protein-like isoform X1 [Liolophura sinensis]|uniref:C-myc promoter-binding protein-like isoform X1 n=1 Tax=Liolophura sinensis TaxID=3198878 RepID=UPI0031588979
MEDRRVADYFVVAGLPDNPLPLEEFSNEAIIKPTHKLDPITDITIINKSLGEKIPKGFTCIERTPTGLPADLNHGSIRCNELFLCYRRGRDKAPLSDIGVLYEGKERVMPDSEVVYSTPFGHPANVNNSSSNRIYITYRRAKQFAASDSLAVVDICIILTNKGESPPHAYCQIAKNLNKGMVGSDVFLCYKKAMTKQDVLAYKPAILNRYPLEDYENFPLPESVPMFCLPMGATIECWSAKAQHPLPVFSTFILTGAAGEQVYGAAVTFYEEFPEERLTDLQMRHLGLKNKHIREQYRILKNVHFNKCICLLSHYPFFDAFKKFLSYLYKIAITGPHNVPIERHISHFMFEVPYPSPQRPRILVQLRDEALSLSMPEDSPLPQSGASFVTLLKNLGPDNCMNMLLHVLTEQKILIHSLRPAVLTGVAEAVSTIIFPFHWQCPYIPLCPLGLSDVLNAPCPFIVGIDSRYFELYDPPPDVICVDLDTNTIWLPEEKRSLSFKQLPKKPAKVLQETLIKLFEEWTQMPSAASHVHEEISLEMPSMDFDFKRKRKETLMELSIQEAFLRFMACLMKGYKPYLKPITKAPTLSTTDANSLFDLPGFFKSRDKAYHKFFTQFMRTQTFIRFLEERSFVSTNDAGLAFFDECTEKVEETRDEPKLIETDDSVNSERTVFILPPEPTDLPEGKTYSYNGFPPLNYDLFLQKTKTHAPLSGKQSGCPHSPMARRTKQEVKSAQKMAQQHITTPHLWSKCLLAHCYSLWFVHLPAFVKNHASKPKALQLAYEVLKRMQRVKLQPPDEICFRVLLQLCGQYHQPVLAVKVLFDMKRAGVQPNAITYGYYNKAVLESKWPSVNSRGMLLWNKLRNVILGVARFRKLSRRRSLSLCSNSGSDFDQISRASIDSYLEDGTGEKVDVHKAGLADDLIAVSTPLEKGNSEERISSGGVSDKGYSSMTQEDAQRLSQALSHSDLLEKSADKTDVSPTKPTRFDRSGFRLSLRKRSRRKENKSSTSSEYDQDGFRIPEIRGRVNSLVRKSCSSMGSTNSFDTLHGSVGSAAGLLMVSQTSLDESVFGHLGELHLSTSLGQEDITRKRHKSAGDHGQMKQRSVSLLEKRGRHSSDDEKTAQVIRFCDFAKKRDGHDKSIVNGDVFTDSHRQESSAGAVNAPSDGMTVKSGGDNPSTDLSVYGSKDAEQTISPIVKPPQSLQLNSQSSQSNVMRTEEDKRTPTIHSPRGSPERKSATPVLTNDPLGAFNEPLQNRKKDSGVSGSVSPTHKKKLPKSPLTTTSPLRTPKVEDAESLFGRKSSVVSENSVCSCDDSSSKAVGVNCVCNSPSAKKPWLTDLQGETPISRTSSLPGGSQSAVQSPSEVIDTKTELSRTSSTPEWLSSPEKSRLSLWGLRSPFRQAGETVQSPDTSTSSPKMEVAKEFAFRRTQSLRKSKDAVSKMLKFTASAMATKFNEFKQSMSTPTKSDSFSSLGQSSDRDSIDSNDMENQDTLKSLPRGFGGSLDYVRGNDRDSDDSTSADKVSISSDKRYPQGSAKQSYGGMDYEESSCKSASLWSLRQTLENIAVEVEMSSCSRCNQCRSLLYDEEIMTGWSADDSNLNTSCVFCNAKLVPELQIFVKDWRVDARSRSDSTSHKTHGTKTRHTSLSNCDHNEVLFEGDKVPGDDPSPPKDTPDPDSLESSETSGDKTVTSPMDMSEAANAARRRCTSECMTTATEYMPSVSSVDSHDGCAITRPIRSPVDILIDEDMELPSKPAAVPELKKDFISRSSSNIEPIVVPYLSPLVLRKEVESVLDSEGDMSLASDTFADEHPIIFWNLLWYLRRIELTSYLTGFVLTAKSLNPTAEQGAPASCPYDHRNVLIRPIWDNVRLQEDYGPPMYMEWNMGQQSSTVNALLTDGQSFSKSDMQQIVTSIRCCDVYTPMRIVMNARRKMRRGRTRFRSMYREILYLSFVACGRENIDHDAYDQEYKKAYNRLTPQETRQLQPDDKPRPEKVIQCRRQFSELEL